MRNILLASFFSLICYLYIDIFVATAISSVNLSVIHPFLKTIEKAASFGSLSIIWAFATLYSILYNKRKCHLFLNGCLSFFFSFFLIYLLKIITGRARPSLLLDSQLYGFQFFTLSNHYFSFPSSHAAAIFIIGCSLSCLFPRYKGVVFASAISIALLRVFTLNHFLSDIVMGATLAYELTNDMIKKNRANAWFARFLIKN
ncbi:MAG: phosphatase PAP2 family protein [Chlamydiales bacterium]|nr:phosphatase PAP2 family protein [Chlamydiales bacterium]